MKADLNVRFRGQYEEFPDSLIMCVVSTVSPVPVVFDNSRAPDLEIVGPAPRRRFLKKFTRRKRGNSDGRLFGNRTKAKVVLFHSEENSRYVAGLADYSIGPDIGFARDDFFRMPNWWSSIDWSSQGVNHKPSPRIRNLIRPDQLCEPLGASTLERPRRAAIFATHMTEPRVTLLRELSNVIEIDGFGRHFDKSVAHHNKSGFYKDDVLKGYMFCLCPEGGMYPGYYTERIPESYGAGSIPLGFADQNVDVDFQGGFVNLANFAGEGYARGFERALEPANLERLVSTPLMDRPPDIRGLLGFMDRIISRALGGSGRQVRDSDPNLLANQTTLKKGRYDA